MLPSKKETNFPPNKSAFTETKRRYPRDTGSVGCDDPPEHIVVVIEAVSNRFLNDVAEVLKSDILLR